jgi:hypothetical protein
MVASLALRRAFTKLNYAASMATASTIAGDPRSRASATAAAVTTRRLWLALVVVAATVFLRAFGSVDADVSWQLWVAHQLNDGARLYRDIVEINPPLWYWMGLPIDGLAGLIHARSDHVLVPVIGLLAALSLTATDRLLAGLNTRQRALLIAYAALVLVVMPWLQFGQREQIVLAGALPYAALIAARQTGRTVSPLFALLVGAGAALGFALKHYFLLVPVLLELWLLASQGRKWRPFRAETIAMAAVGIVYGAALFLWSTDYVSLALPLIFLTYGLTGAERLIDLFQPAVLTALATLALLLANRRLLRSDKTRFSTTLIVAALGFAGAYFIQAKGWSYHAVPLVGCAAMALAASLTAEAKPRFVVVAAPALLVLPFWISVQQATRDLPTQIDVRQAVVGLHAGDSVGYISTDPSLGWPVTLERGLHYPSRYSGYWMMRAVVKNDAAVAPDPHLAEVGRRVVRETVDDFQCLPPRRIIVARPAPEAAAAGEFDILDFFLRDPEFTRLLAHYRPVERTSVEVFERVSPVAQGRDCIRRAED